MMKLGIVLPTWTYNTYRLGLAQETFASLLKTKSLPEGETPHLLILVRQSGTPCNYPLKELMNTFEVHVNRNCVASGTEPTLLWGTQWLFDSTDCTHVTWMGDDALFNSNWLSELKGLISRHPNALSYTLYHSARQEYHTDLAPPDENGDVPVKSICGHCLTIEKNRWNSLGLNWQQPEKWNKPELGYGTVDLWDAMNNFGERWASYKSYVEHTGAHGINCSPACNEVAMNFQKD